MLPNGNNMNSNTTGLPSAHQLQQDGQPAKLFLNQQQLARAWDVSQRSTANDWHEWLWRFNIDLLRESPMPTMRACAPLAQAHEAMVSLTCILRMLFACICHANIFIVV